MFLRHAFAVVLVISGLPFAQAQIGGPRVPGAGQRQLQVPPNMQQTEIQGTIQGVMHGRIAVLDTNSQNWQVLVPNAAKIEVTGTLAPGNLQSGMVVEFKGEVDDRGMLKEKVAELAIVSLSPEKQLGAFSDSDLGADQGGFGDGGDAKKKAKPAKHKPTSGKKMTAGAYRFVAKLTVGHGGKLTAMAGRTALALALADDAKITIESADYTIASQGDQITVKAITAPNRPGMAQATEVKIELSPQAASPTKKKGGAKAEPKKSSKKPKKADADEAANP